MTARLTREHEYTSALLNADKMRSPLLCDLPYVADEDGRYTVTIHDVEEMRLPTLRGKVSPMSFSISPGYFILTAKTDGHNCVDPPLLLFATVGSNSRHSERRRADAAYGAKPEG